VSAAPSRCNMTGRPAKILCIVFLLVGLLVSGHLLFRSIALVEGAAEGGDVCSTVFGTGCDATLKDPFSEQFGIPLAGWGVIYFATILVLLLLGSILDESFRVTATAAASLLALLGAVASVGLIVSLLLGLFPLCPLCFVVNGLNLFATALVLRWSGRSFRQQARSWWAGIRYVTGAKPADAMAARWHVVGFILVALMAATIYQWVLIEADRAANAEKEFDSAKVLADYEAETKVELPVHPENATIGPEDARATLVVFSDAFCPFCRMFWAGIIKVTKPYEGDLRVVFKHFPLESMCNSSVPAAMHPMACHAALALQAAKKQGQFWGYHEALFDPRTIRLASR